jgi:5-methyltetrahydrofolate--homocysteine methyltransferase
LFWKQGELHVAGLCTFEMDWRQYPRVQKAWKHQRNAPDYKNFQIEAGILICAMNDQHPLTQAIIAGKRKEVPALVQQCLDAGETAAGIVENRLVPGMMAVGERFKRNEIFVPEMLIAARAMKEALKILEPMLVAAGVKPEHNAVIGTVEGDLHDIGKNLVAMMWKGANIEVIDLGVNVPAAKFVEAVKQHHPKLLGLSALLTTTMPAMRDTVKAVRDAGLPVKIVVGGAPITNEFAREIGADGYSPDAGTAVDTALALLQGKP